MGLEFRLTECRRAVMRGLVATLVTSVAALGAGPASAQQQPIVMKFATLTLNDIQHEYIKVYKDELEKATGGRIKVEIYPAAQLGGAPRQVEGLRLGTIEAAIGPSELFFGADPRFQVLAMAGLFRDNDHARKALDLPEFRKAITDFTVPRGIITTGLNVYDQQVIVSKPLIEKLADFPGKRLRVLASEGEQQSVVALGASAVPMGLPEVLPAIQQGTVVGASSVLGVFVSFRYYDAAPNILDTRLWALIPVALVSRVWYEKLPADLQKAVVDTGRKIEPQIHQWQVERIAADRKTWVEKGGKFYKLSANEQATAQKNVEAAIDRVLAKAPSSKALYDTLKATAATIK